MPSALAVTVGQGGFGNHSNNGAVVAMVVLIGDPYIGLHPRDSYFTCRLEGQFEFVLYCSLQHIRQIVSGHTQINESGQMHIAGDTAVG